MLVSANSAVQVNLPSDSSGSMEYGFPDPAWWNTGAVSRRMRMGNEEHHVQKWRDRKSVV